MADKQVNFKYKEDVILKDILEYLAGTYGEHYVTKDKELQAIDYIHSLGIAREFCIGNSIKYSGRYGKKEGLNKKDILKAIHYLLFVMYFDHYDEGD